MTLPEHIDTANTGQLRDELLGLVNRGPKVLIADLSGTASCDHGGADALARAHHRASVNGTQLRIAASSPHVRRILTVSGLDRLVSVYPSLAAALAARPPQAGFPPAATAAATVRPGGPLITPAVLWSLLGALADGLIVATAEGTLVLASRRAEDIFGYKHGELAGQPVEALVPEALQGPHAVQRARYQRHPADRPMGTRGRLAGLRKDGTTFPVQVSLSPVPTATGHLILAVVRDLAYPRPRPDLATLARSIAAGQAAADQNLVDQVTSALYQLGLTLHKAGILPRDQALGHLETRVRELDDLICEIQDQVSGRADEPPGTWHSTGSPHP
jgi:anti-anti-sigma factor